MIKKLPINDPTGALKNINDLLDELRNDNVSALAVVFTRKDDQSTRTFRNGLNRVLLVGTLEQLKFDVLESDLEDVEITDYDRGLDGKDADEEEG